MKVVFVVARDRYFFTHRFDFAKYVQSFKNRVGVITTEGGYTSQFEAAGMKVETLPFERGGMNPFKELFFIWHLKNRLNQMNPDIVHYVALKPVLYGMILHSLGMLKSKPIFAISGLGIAFRGTSWSMCMVRVVLKMFFKGLFKRRQVVIVQNAFDQEILKQLHVKADVHLIPGAGVDTEVFKPLNGHIESKKLRIIMAARLLRSKGVPEFLNAARALGQRDFEFYLCGEPDLQNSDSIDMDDVYAAVRDGTLQYLGHVDDMAAIYQKMDIAVLPTVYGEGVPKTLLEAMSAGLPIITTSMPGCAELVNGNGIVIAPHSSESLIMAIRKISEMNLKERMELSLRSREIILQKFSNDIIYKRIYGLYA